VLDARRSPLPPLARRAPSPRFRRPLSRGVARVDTRAPPSPDRRARSALRAAWLGRHGVRSRTPSFGARMNLGRPLQPTHETIDPWIHRFPRLARENRARTDSGAHHVFPDEHGWRRVYARPKLRLTRADCPRHEAGGAVYLTAPLDAESAPIELQRNEPLTPLATHRRPLHRGHPPRWDRFRPGPRKRAWFPRSGAPFSDERSNTSPTREPAPPPSPLDPEKGLPGPRNLPTFARKPLAIGAQSSLQSPNGGPSTRTRAARRRLQSTTDPRARPRIAETRSQGIDQAATLSRHPHGHPRGRPVAKFSTTCPQPVDFCATLARTFDVSISSDPRPDVPQSVHHPISTIFPTRATGKSQSPERILLGRGARSGLKSRPYSPPH
jgi:hypothetical protein